jgi:biopolymer transport protein ExbD
MRVASSRQHDDRREDCTLTPMIDVVFLLLIFFVCASIGQIQESLLPTQMAAGALEADTIVEAEKPFGEVWLRLVRTPDLRTVVELNERRIEEFAELRQVLSELAADVPEIPVILDIDGGVPWGDLVRVYDACLAANFETIQFAVEPPP